MSQPPFKKQKFQSKKKFFQPKRKQYLEVGQKGYLATCNFNEKDCVRECYNILNQYADELFGKEDNTVINDENKDISDELQSQITDSQTNCKIKHRFQAVDTGATNCVFIKTTLDEHHTVAERIVDDIVQSQQQKTRHLYRLLPIEIICKANEKDIIDAAGKLCDKFFLKEPTTFSIVFNKRFNNDINRDQLIHEVANLVHAKNVQNKVDLKNAKRSLIIEVIKGLCCLTVLDDYMAKRKYNLVELARTKLDDIQSEHKSDQKICENSIKGERSKSDEKEVAN